MVRTISELILHKSDRHGESKYTTETTLRHVSMNGPCSSAVTDQSCVRSDVAAVRHPAIIVRQPANVTRSLCDTSYTIAQPFHQTVIVLSVEAFKTEPRPMECVRTAVITEDRHCVSICKRVMRSFVCMTLLSAAYSCNCRSSWSTMSFKDLRMQSREHQKMLNCPPRMLSTIIFCSLTNLSSIVFCINDIK